MSRASVFYTAFVSGLTAGLAIAIVLLFYASAYYGGSGCFP